MLDPAAVKRTERRLAAGRVHKLTTARYAFNTSSEELVTHFLAAVRLRRELD